MFEQSVAAEPRNVLGDWALRLGVGLIAILVGWEKFPSDTMWVEMYQQIGLGQWFRYFTGVVEILGGVLVLIPRLAAAGLALLAVTMVAASLIHIFVLGHPGNAPITGILAIVLFAYAWSRWNAFQ
jgi:putative oxidoreductase